eukprot:6820307-Prymnesium_polylepis.1
MEERGEEEKGQEDAEEEGEKGAGAEVENAEQDTEKGAEAAVAEAEGTEAAGAKLEGREPVDMESDDEGIECIGGIHNAGATVVAGDGVAKRPEDADGAEGPESPMDDSPSVIAPNVSSQHMSAHTTTLHGLPAHTTSVSGSSSSIVAPPLADRSEATMPVLHDPQQLQFAQGLSARGIRAVGWHSRA